MAPLRSLLVAVGFAASLASAFDIRLGERRTVSQARREIEARNLRHLQKRDDTDPALLYPAHNLSMPVDHFHNDTKYEPHSDATFPLRYWFDATYYKPGGPVVVLHGGETDGSDRLPFLQKGLLHQLAKASNGIGVILEHRYYGTSIPTPDFSTENLRFLTVHQALADAAYFAGHVKFPGMKQYGDLTSKTTAWISYGGSYAGAYSAFLRVQYPDAYWGAYSSSGVTEAVWDYWAYFKPIAEHGPPKCIQAQQHLINVMDNIWLNKTHTSLPAQMKNTFGFGGMTHDQDFAEVLANGIYNWQSLNWDPAVGSPAFYEYCANITSTKLLYPGIEGKRSNVSKLITAGGYQADAAFENQMLNMIGWNNLTQIQPCVTGGETLDECYSMLNATYFKLDSLEEGSFRSWPYQYCTEFGFLQTGNTPAGTLPLVSRTVDLDYNSAICRLAFNLTTPADVSIPNQYGGYNISYPRLAIVDGNWDPWKEATPHAYDFGAQHRRSTKSEPFILIPAAVHHWDENGLFPNQTTADLPPSRIKNTQSKEADALLGWMKEWRKHCHDKGGCS